MELLFVLLDSGIEFLGTPFYDADDFWKMIVKTVFNLLMITIIVRYIYYPVTKNKDYLFTYFLISLTVFLLCILLDSVKLQLGFALVQQVLVEQIFFEGFLSPHLLKIPSGI